MEAGRRGLDVTFGLGDAVAPAMAEMSVDIIVCRHFLWTLREPEVALGNWRRLLRPRGRVVVIDGFWFVNDGDTSEAEKEPGLFERHYTKQTREGLMSDLTDVHRPGKTRPLPSPGTW